MRNLIGASSIHGATWLVPVAYLAQSNWCECHTRRDMIGVRSIPSAIWLVKATYPEKFDWNKQHTRRYILVPSAYLAQSDWCELHTPLNLIGDSDTAFDNYIVVIVYLVFVFKNCLLWGGKLWQVPRNCRKQNRTYLKINAHEGKNSRVWNFVQVLQLSILPSNADYHSGALILNIHPLKIVRFDPGAMYPAMSWLGKLGPKRIKIKVEP